MTVTEVVKALGGDQAVAEMFDVGKTAVINWRSWNRFPAKCHLRVLRECAARGIAYDPDPQSQQVA